jgi:hypothetical protein
MKKIRCATVMGSIITFSLALLLSLTWAGLVLGESGVNDPKTTPSTKQSPTSTRDARTLDVNKNMIEQLKFDAMKKASKSEVSEKGCAAGVADAAAGKAWMMAMGVPGGSWVRVELSTLDISASKDLNYVHVSLFGRFLKNQGGAVKVKFGVKSDNADVKTWEYVSTGAMAIPANHLEFNMKANKKYRAYVEFYIDASAPDEAKAAVAADIKFDWRQTTVGILR